ncbi:hypothetical protein HYN56_22205 [Flavobacterium crocinum]|uniref:Uncharacterized protein n=1 Tax=Flavobacterium crocinum TaxID=2183896 RepID=A0A2S1YRP8_9FLAO|nr:hypothetical protein [Flavobacterium crocinum]AWK06794.1 hypothetical protein HYN56_22205 [Flavobacterium crocinum]
MTDQNKNRKNRQNQTKSINSTSFSKIPHLYGMTLEEYKEGVAIHSRCFDQIKMIKTTIY